MDVLPILYQKMADITSPVCENECSGYRDKQYRCCEIKYCLLAAKFTKEKYSIELKPTGNTELLFMGEKGCTVPPYLRPVCALHACPISYAGISCIGNSEFKTKEYFTLRKEIETEAKFQNKLPEYV